MAEKKNKGAKASEKAAAKKVTGKAEAAKATNKEKKPVAKGVGGAEKKATEKKAEKVAKPEQKSKTGWLIGLVVAAVLIIIGIVVASYFNNKTDQSDPTAQIDYSESFFIYDDSNYSLWNADGKRLTEDNYQTQSGFVGGYAMVKKDDQYGIINESGRMSVDFGKYGSISAKGGLYLAEDGNTKEQFLITGTGKVLERGEDLVVDTPNSTSGFAVVVNDGKLKIYNYAGTLIEQADALNEEAPEMNTLRDFGIIHYGDQNWVFDARSGQLVASFDGPRYSFDTVSEDRTMILLDDYENSEKYKLLANGKIYELNETKYYGLTDLNNLLGYDNYSELALLDNDYGVARRTSTYLQLKDTNNYAEEKGDGGVEIYHNGEKVKEFGGDAEIATSGLLYNDYYAVREGEKVKFYNLDGSVAFEKEFDDVDILSDRHHHAVVAEKEGEYYLIDAKGNRVSEVVARDISPYNGGYKAKNSDGKYAILDKNGKPVTDFRYTEVLYRSIAEPHNIWTGKNENGMSDVIDADSGKAIFGGAKVNGIYSNYFTVKSDEDVVEYYTFDGKLFYSTAKK